MNTRTSSALSPDADPLRKQDTATRVRFTPMIVIAGILGAVLGAVGVSLTVLLQLVPETAEIFGLEFIRHHSHPSGEATIYAWYSTLLLAALGLAFAVIASVKWHIRFLRWRYLVLASTALLLSADEAGMLHEEMARIASSLGLSWAWTYNWLIAAVPLALVAGAFILWLALRIDARLRSRLILAGAIFFLGAIVVESLGGMLENRTLTLGETAHVYIFHLSFFVEESLEIGGVLVALWAALSYLKVMRSPSGLTVTTDDPERSVSFQN